MPRYREKPARARLAAAENIALTYSLERIAAAGHEELTRWERSLGLTVADASELAILAAIRQRRVELQQVAP